MNKRVKAFTIMEITIAMLLAAIVIAITYTVYMIVVRSYSSYNAKSSNMAVLIRLDELLRKDFEKNEMIQRTETGLLCTQRGKVVTYEFMPKAIIRSSGIIDTFEVTTETINSFFEDRPVSGSTMSEEGRIDELQLLLVFGEKKITNTYFKHYSSENLIQRKTNAVN
jgi:Tfp pilus assembly protein PilE